MKPYNPDADLVRRLTKEDFYGQVEGRRFVVHKTQEHILRIFDAFACGEERLRRMHSMGVREAFIYYYPDNYTCELYKADLDKWLQGSTWEHRMPGGVEIQRMITKEECEKC